MLKKKSLPKGTKLKQYRVRVRHTLVRDVFVVVSEASEDRALSLAKHIVEGDVDAHVALPWEVWTDRFSAIEANEEKKKVTK